MFIEFVCLSFVRLQRKINNTWQCIIGLIRQQIRLFVCLSVCPSVCLKPKFGRLKTKFDDDADNACGVREAKRTQKTKFDPTFYCTVQWGNGNRTILGFLVGPACTSSKYLFSTLKFLFRLDQKIWRFVQSIGHLFDLPSICLRSCIWIRILQMLFPFVYLLWNPEKRYSSLAICRPK